MVTCPNGHENPKGQHFCGECGKPIVAKSEAELLAPGRRATRTPLAVGVSVKVVAPGDDHDGRIGTVYEVLDDDADVCIKFNGDSEPYAYGRDELEAVPTPRHKPASKPTGSMATGSLPRQTAPSEADKSNSGKQAAVAIGVCVIVVIGLVMSMQSVTLLTGSGQVWTGVAVVAAGTALAFFMRAATWVRVVAALLLAVSLANGLYIENQLSDKRHELTRMFDR